MKFQFLTPALHGILDYIAAGALIVMPFALGLTGTALWLSVAGGTALILYSILTDYRFGALRIVSYDLHLFLDLAAAIAFSAAPFLLRFDQFTSAYYFAMAAGVVGVVTLSDRRHSSSMKQA